jgi:hypothetical protein
LFKVKNYFSTKKIIAKDINIAQLTTVWVVQDGAVYPMDARFLDWDPNWFWGGVLLDSLAVETQCIASVRIFISPNHEIRFCVQMVTKYAACRP